MTIFEQWSIKTPQEQLDFIRACIVRNAPLELERETVSWFIEYHGMDDLAAEAWLHIAQVTPEALDKLNAGRETPVTLSGIVWRAARHAIRVARRGDSKHYHEALDWMDEDGGEHSRPIASGDDVEGEALYQDWLNSFMEGLDETDTQIIRGKLAGMQGNELATIIGISPAAISKRLKKLRGALTAA